MKLQYFTYFLNKNSQYQLPINGEVNKIQLISDILSNSIIFYRNGHKTIYIPRAIDGNYIWGEIGKEGFVKISEMTKNGFRETDEKTYPHCNIFIKLDPDNGHGQQIIVEKKSDVFTDNITLLEYFEKYLNTILPVHGYAINIHPKLENKNFWEVIKNNKDKIEKIKLSLAVPNLFNLEGELNDDLKELNKNYQATNTQIEMSNKGGTLNIPEDDFMKQSSEYIERGGGSYKVKIQGLNEEIDSNKNIKTRKIDTIEIESNDASGFPEQFKNLFIK